MTEPTPPNETPAVAAYRASQLAAAQGRRKRGWRIAGVLVGAAALVALLLSQMGGGKQQEVRITFATGKVTVLGIDEEGRPAVMGELVTEGMRFETAEKAEVDLGIAEIGGIKLEGKSQMSVDKLEKKSGGAAGIQFDLWMGRMFQKYHGMESGSEVRIIVPAGQVFVRGTEFFLETDGAETLLAVREGTVVAVSDADKSREVPVPAGSMVRIAATGVEPVEPVGDREKELFWRIDEIAGLPIRWAWNIEPQFEAVLPFTDDGLAAAKLGGKWGFIDKAGNFAIRPQWEAVHSFREGRAAVSVDGKWGFVDMKGKVVAAPKWEAVGGFLEKRARVQENGKWGFIDPGGEVVAEPEWDLPDSRSGRFGFLPKNFHHGMVAVSKSKKWGILGLDGELIVQPEWDRVTRITEEGVGLSRKVGEDSRGTNLIFIDPDGNQFFDSADCPLKGDRFSSTGFAEGLAQIAFMTRGGQRIAYIDASGEVVVPDRRSLTNWMADYSEGLAAVHGGRKGNELSFIDKQGNVAFTLDGAWKLLVPMSGGLAVGRKGEPVPVEGRKSAFTSKDLPVYFIDKSGAIIEPKWPDGELGRLDLYVERGFHDGLIPFNHRGSLGKGAGMMDRSGEIVIPPRFAYPGRFHSGYACFLTRNMHRDTRDSPMRFEMVIVDRAGRRVAGPADCILMGDTHYHGDKGPGSSSYIEHCLKTGDPIPFLDEVSGKYGFIELSDADVQVVEPSIPTVVAKPVPPGPLPVPVIRYAGIDEGRSAGKPHTIHFFELVNGDKYHPSLFEKMPDPRVPENRNRDGRSRVYLKTYDSSGKERGGYVGLLKKFEKNHRFSVSIVDGKPATGIYITIEDRQTGEEHRSNTIDIDQP